MNTIDLLKRQKTEIDKLRNEANSENSEFIKWHSTTLSVIEKRFGKSEADNFPSMLEFKSGVFLMDDPDTNDYNDLLAYKHGLKKADAYISSLIEQIELLGDNHEATSKQSLNSGNKNQHIVINGGNVTLGDGSTINHITIENIIQTLQKEIESKVPESDEKRSVLEALKAMTSNESFASITGAFVGSILQKMLAPR